MQQKIKKYFTTYLFMASSDPLVKLAVLRYVYHALPDTSKETAYSLFVGLPSIGCKTIPETPSTTSITRSLELRAFEEFFPINHWADAVEPVLLIGFVKSYVGDRFPHLCYLWGCWFSYTRRLFRQMILYSTHWKISRTSPVTKRKREKSSA